MATIDLLTKTPFARITAKGYRKGLTTLSLSDVNYFEDKEEYQLVSQGDFLREYYPSGHLINSEEWYPDRIKYEDYTDETGKTSKRYYKEKVIRVSVPFQMIIVAQQLVHTFGNNVKHTIISPNPTLEEVSNFYEWRMGWLEKNMEIALYEFGKSLFITADAATVFYVDGGKLGIKNLSYLSGDTLFPHYNSVTGELDTFARKYYDYDENNSQKTEWVEVWDKTYLTRYNRPLKGTKGAISRVKELFGLDGFVQVGNPKPHGFEEVPIVYYRIDGPVWSGVQDDIDHWELGFSHLTQNNLAFAFPIMVLKSDEGAEVDTDMYGAVKAIKMGTADSADYLKHDESPKSFELFLEKLSEMIFLGAFIVKTPEVKSGDLPGVAIKLIYSPSLDKAILNKKDLDKCIDKMQRLFTVGYGIEKGKITQYKNLHFLSEIDPYVHQNNTELISNLVQSVTGGFLSKDTASQINPFSMNNEMDKIIGEEKQKQQQDLLYQLKTNQQTAPQQVQQNLSNTATGNE
jgi:hypothetical protein